MAITKAGESQSFGYTGGVQSFTIPFDGLYKLEVYGARGGNYVKPGSGTGSNVGSSHNGGYGGYACGYKQLTKGQVLYIVCGGAGTFTAGTTAAISGGYNGGGAIDTNYSTYPKASGLRSSASARRASTCRGVAPQSPPPRRAGRALPVCTV